MLRSDASYPYPVLRTTATDFKKTVFKDDISVETTPEGYRLTANFSVNNDRISELIEAGVLKYGIFITCKSTLLREMHYIDRKHPVIELEAGKIHYQVNYIAYITAAQNIDHYYDDDFIEDYADIEFSLNAGSIVGIGIPRYFKALYEKDQISDASSVIRVQGIDNDKYMSVDLDNPQIIVQLPQEQCTWYKNCKQKKDKYPLLHSVIIIPALMEAIHAMAEAPDEYENRPWYITLEQQIKSISALLHEEEKVFYEDPLRTAQIIMQNNSASALKIIYEDIS